MEPRSDENGEEAIEDEGVESIVEGEVERKSLTSRERLNSEKGRDGWKCVGEAGVPNRLALGAGFESRDSKRVISFDTAICEAVEGSRFERADATGRK